MPTIAESARVHERSPDRSAEAVPAWVDTGAYPFTPRRVTLAEGRMHYVDEGAGETLLFVHGTPTWSFEWRHLIRALAPRWRCIAPDHLGFGLSDRPRDADYGPEAHARRLGEFARRLALDEIDEGITLVVHDYGGPIALPLALDGIVRVKRLVVLNSWMWSFEDDRDMVTKARIAGGRLGRFLYRHLNFSLKVIVPSAFADRRTLTPALHRQYLAPFPDAWSRGAVLWPLARAILGSSAHYASLWARRERLRSVPALIVWGTRDPAFRMHQLARWREALPAARVVELPVGHWPQEEAPDAVAGALRAFLSEPSASR